MLKVLLCRLDLNDRVIVSGGKIGALRYLGQPQFAAGVWCGVELDEPMGKNDGSIQVTLSSLHLPSFMDYREYGTSHVNPSTDFSPLQRRLRRFGESCQHEKEDVLAGSKCEHSKQDSCTPQ